MVVLGAILQGHFGLLNLTFEYIIADSLSNRRNMERILVILLVGVTLLAGCNRVAQTPMSPEALAKTYIEASTVAISRDVSAYYRMT